MLISSKEKLKNIQPLIDAFALLGGRLYVEEFFPRSIFRVELLDGTQRLSQIVPKSHSGICFAFWEGYIEIRRLHVNINRRNTGLSKALLAPLIKYGETNNVLKFKVASANDSFWEHIQDTYRQIAWEVLRDSIADD